MSPKKMSVTSQHPEEDQQYKENEEDGDMLSDPENSSSIDVRAFNLRTVIDNSQYYPANYSVRSSWTKFDWIKDYLNKNERVESLFRKSCFGHFLDLSNKWIFPGLLCHYMLLHSVESRKKLEMWFIVDNKPLCFGMKEFALVTGLNCGPMPCKEDRDKVVEEANNFSQKILRGRNSVKGQDLENMLRNDKAYSVTDKYKICLILFIHYVLMAKDPSKTVEADWISFVNDPDYFNSFPWGKSSFELTIDCLQSRNMEKSYKEWQSDKNHLSRFNLQGFPWAFMVWAFEAIPLFARLGDCLIPPKEDSLRPIPRMLQYHLKRTAKWDYDTLESLLKSNEVVVNPFLIPSKREMRERFISSFEEREDYSDENIDRLKKTLEGVTKLTKPSDLFDEDSTGIKNATNPLAITPLGEMKSTPPLPSSPPPVHSPPPPPVNQKVEIPQNILMSISEEKKKLFYRWYNKKDSSKRAIGYNGDYDHNFFNEILNVGAWFNDLHLHEGLTAIRHKQRRFPHFYDQHCAVLDAYFHQVLDGQVARLSKTKPSNPAKKAKKYVKAGPTMSMVEIEKHLLENSYNKVFDEYFKGKRPRNGRNWSEVRKVYAILHVANIHWITIVWLLDEGRIELLDCNRTCYKKETLEAAMWGPTVLFPKLLKASCQFTHLNQEIFDRQWKYTFVDNLPTNSHGGDCGIYSLEFVEFHMSKTPLDGLTDTQIPYFREALAIEIFQKEE